MARVIYFFALLGYFIMPAVAWSNNFIDHQTGSTITQQGKIEDSVFPYAKVTADYGVNIATDLSEHPNFYHELWSYKAQLEGDDGEDYTVQWLFYRLTQSPTSGNGWKNNQVYTSQVIVTNKERVWSQQRVARGGIGQAGVLMYPLRIWLDNWSWVSNNNQASSNELNVVADDFSVKMKSSPHGPFVLNGDHGFQRLYSTYQKAIYSFSMPFLRSSGVLTLGDRKVKVQGQAWLEKEWGDQLISDHNLSWEKFIIHLNDGRSLSLIQTYDGQQRKYITGSLATRDGGRIELKNEEVRTYPIERIQLVNGRELPLRWVIEIPKYHLSLITHIENKEMWLPFWIPSWQGSIRVTGTQTGRGFMQLTDNKEVVVPKGQFYR